MQGRGLIGVHPRKRLEANVKLLAGSATEAEARRYAWAHEKRGAMLIDRVFHELHAADSAGLTKTQRVVLVAIMVAVLLAIIGTEPALPTEVRDSIEAAEFAFGILFAVEYCFRVWSIGALPEFKGLRGRVRYMIKPMAVVDAVALVPFLVGALGGESLLLRLIRVFRLAALSKALRYSRAMQIVMSAVYERGEACR